MRIWKNVFIGCNKLSSIVFEDTTSVWYKTENSDFTGGESVGTMSDASTNANLLKNNYGKYFYSERYVAGE